MSWPLIVGVLLVASPAEPEESVEVTDRWDLHAAWRYAPEHEFSAKDPRAFRYRGTTVGLGMRFSWLLAECAVPRGCGLSPAVDIMSEVGWRRFRLGLGLETAPVPYAYVDDYAEDVVLLSEFIGMRVALLAGGERVRGGFSGHVGAGIFGVGASLWVTPWRAPRGGRHGFELMAGYDPWFGSFYAGVGYRWGPPALNHPRRTRIPWGPESSPARDRGRS